MVDHRPQTGPPARDPPPRFRRERCLHHRHLAAGCAACIAACGRGAIGFDRRGIWLDPHRCDGCGICTVVCPEAAFALSSAPVLGEYRHRPAAFFACARVRDRPPARVPCLHALGLRDLARLWSDGVRVLVVAGTSCEDCPRYGGAPDLSDNVTRLARLLRSRGMPPLDLEILPADAFGRAVMRAPFVDPGKRRLLRRRAFGPPRARGGAPLHPFVPVFDAPRCVGCDACVRGCPHGALELLRGDQGEALAYRVRAEDCTGCGLCADLCEEGAIAVENDRPASSAVPLRTARCPVCAAEFHEPAVRPEAALCRVCRRATTVRRPSRVVA